MKYVEKNCLISELNLRIVTCFSANNEEKNVKQTGKKGRSAVNVSLLAQILLCIFCHSCEKLNSFLIQVYLSLNVFVSVSKILNSFLKYPH